MVKTRAYLPLPCHTVIMLFTFSTIGVLVTDVKAKIYGDHWVVFAVAYVDVLREGRDGRSKVRESVGRSGFCDGCDLGWVSSIGGRRIFTRAGKTWEYV